MSDETTAEIGQQMSTHFCVEMEMQIITLWEEQRLRVFENIWT